MKQESKRKFTTLEKVRSKMNAVYETGIETEIGNLTNPFGEFVPRTSLSMYVNKITNESFHGCTFYTRTKNGVLVLGCHTPRLADSETV